MVLIAVLIVGASAQLGAASEQETWIVVQSDGEERAAFVPAKEPYTEGGPAVSVYLRSKNVRTKDGLVITGFEFIGWKEATSNRVLVFALVPRDDAENTYMPDGDPKNLRRRDFTTHTVGGTESIAIEKMRTLGIDPMVIRAELRNAPQ